jgi:hypothetical protein
MIHTADLYETLSSDLLTLVPIAVVAGGILIRHIGKKSNASTTGQKIQQPSLRDQKIYFQNINLDIEV